MWPSPSLLRISPLPLSTAPRLRLGHLEIDPLTLAGAVDAVEALVVEGRGGFVVTPNVDHVIIAERSLPFRDAYRAAALSLADGQPIVWSSRLLGQPLPEKVSGSDLVLPLMERAAARRWRVFLLGAGPGVAEEAAGKLQHLGVEVVGTAAPHVPAESGRPDPEGDQAVERIQALRPHLVLVAFGAPKQELWMHRRSSALAPSVLLGLGARPAPRAGPSSDSPSAPAAEPERQRGERGEE